MNEEDFENEVKELVNWSEQLNFEKYIENWHF